jgi:hypothetical protein
MILLLGDVLAAEPQAVFPSCLSKLSSRALQVFLKCLLPSLLKAFKSRFSWSYCCKKAIATGDGKNNTSIQAEATTQLERDAAVLHERGLRVLGLDHRCVVFVSVPASHFI